MHVTNLTMHVWMCVHVPLYASMHVPLYLSITGAASRLHQARRPPSACTCRYVLAYLYASSSSIARLLAGVLLECHVLSAMSLVPSVVHQDSASHDMCGA